MLRYASLDCRTRRKSSSTPACRPWTNAWQGNDEELMSQEDSRGSMNRQDAVIPAGPGRRREGGREAEFQGRKAGRWLITPRIL